MSMCLCVILCGLCGSIKAKSSKQLWKQKKRFSYIHRSGTFPFLPHSNIDHIRLHIGMSMCLCVILCGLCGSIKSKEQQAALEAEEAFFLHSSVGYIPFFLPHSNIDHTRLHIDMFMCLCVILCGLCGSIKSKEQQAEEAFFPTSFFTTADPKL